MIKPKRHPDRLMPSQPDDIELVIAIVDRYNGLVEHHLRIKGEHLLIPSTIVPAMNLLIRVKERYQQSDYRHSESEKKAIREFAEWTCLINSAMRNQEPEELVWKD